MLEPDEGSVIDNLYRSRYFNFSYTVPEGLEVDENFMQGEEDESAQAFVLLAAYGAAEGQGRKGIVVSADLNINPQAKSAAEYLEKMTREHYRANGFEVVNGARQLSLGGRPFFRIDYSKGTTYQTAVATIARGYVLTFSLAAPTQPELEQLFTTLSTLKFAPAPKRAAGGNSSGRTPVKP